MSNKVVITGLGVLSAAGIGWQPYWNACLEGRSCIRPQTRWGTTNYPFHAGGEVPDFDPKKFVQNRKNIKLMSRDIQFAVAAAKLAFEDGGIQIQNIDHARSGVVIGSCVINNELDELASGYVKAREADGSFSLPKFGSVGVPSLFPLWMLKYLPNMPAGHVTIEFGLRGYSNTVTFSAASGAQAIAEAARVIERGDADVMLAGGADSKLNPMGLSRFELLHMLSKRGQMLPFNASSDGFVAGEGAGILLLESREHAEKRGAKIYAEFAGSASAPDANPSPVLHQDASGKILAMQRAAKDAKLALKDLSGVIANGCGLIDHDRTEALALKNCFASTSVPVTALKAVTGHTVYAAGGIEAVAAVLSVQQDKLPPAQAGASFELSLSRQTVASSINSVMLNSFGFCGQNTSLVFKKGSL